jgi:hypothetical protein
MKAHSVLAMCCSTVLLLLKIAGPMHYGKLGKKGLGLLKSKTPREERLLKRISSSRMSRCVRACVCTCARVFMSMVLGS